jgi:hypothetical protein
MEDFDWDELQVIKDPDLKQVEVSFIKDDEGTIGSSNPCVNIQAPTEYFPYGDNAEHFYIAYINDPLPYDITGSVTNTTGGLCEPNSISVPEEMEASSTFTIPRGQTKVRVDLNLGTALSEDPDYKAAYTATLTSVTGGGKACGDAQCIKFDKGAEEQPQEPDLGGGGGPDPDPGGGDPLDPDRDFPECEPADCNALLTVGLNLTGVTYGTAAEFSAIVADNPLEMEASAITGALAPIYEGIWSIEKAPTSIPTKNFALLGDPIDVDMPLGTGPCYTDRKALGVPGGASNNRFTVLPEIDYWDGINTTAETNACIFGGLCWAPFTQLNSQLYEHRIPLEYIQNGQVDSYGTDLMIYRFSVDYENNELTVRVDRTIGTYSLVDIQKRPLTVEEARDKLFTIECHARSFAYSGPAPDLSPGVPQIEWLSERDYAVLVNGFGFDVRDVQTSSILLEQGTVNAPVDGGVYPEMFDVGAYSWVQMFGVVAPPLPLSVNWKDYLPPNYDEARAAMLRSWQQYTPPSYCLRIP